MSSSDNALFERFARGDDAAFEEIVRRWHGRLCNVLARLVRAAGRRHDAHELDDLAQEVFLRVIRAAPRYRADFAFSTWVYRIALNVARDAARKRRRQGNPEVFDDQNIADGRCGPIEHLDRTEQKQRVEAALAALPQRFREPLVLRQFGELPFSEIARVLRLSQSTVKSRVAAGLVRLRAELARRGLVARRERPRGDAGPVAREGRDPAPAAAPRKLND